MPRYLWCIPFVCSWLDIDANHTSLWQRFHFKNLWVHFYNLRVWFLPGRTSMQCAAVIAVCRPPCCSTYPCRTRCSLLANEHTQHDRPAEEQERKLSQWPAALLNSFEQTPLFKNSLLSTHSAVEAHMSRQGKEIVSAWSWEIYHWPFPPGRPAQQNKAFFPHL